MTKLFKKKDDAELKSVEIKVRMTAIDHEAIKKSADIRCMSVSEYMRRTALGRKAEVDYESHLIVQLSKVVQTIRKLHADYVAKGLTPPEDAMRPVIIEAREAIGMVSNTRSARPSLGVLTQTGGGQGGTPDKSNCA